MEKRSNPTLAAGLHRLPLFCLSAQPTSRHQVPTNTTGHHPATRPPSFCLSVQPISHRQLPTNTTGHHPSSWPTTFYRSVQPVFRHLLPPNTTGYHPATWRTPLLHQSASTVMTHSMSGQSTWQQIQDCCCRTHVLLTTGSATDILAHGVQLLSMTYGCRLMPS